MKRLELDLTGGSFDEPYRFLSGSHSRPKAGVGIGSTRATCRASGAKMMRIGEIAGEDRRLSSRMNRAQQWTYGQLVLAKGTR